MNLPAHIATNLAIFDKVYSKKEDYNPSKYFWAIVIGSILPDFSMYIFLLIFSLRGFSMQEIFSVEYYKEENHFYIDIFNSIPIYLILALVALYIFKNRAIFLVSLSAFLHSLSDFFLHNDDAHAHFQPFSSFRFESPLSYWDPNHYGHIVGTVEGVIVLSLGILFLLKNRDSLSRVKKGVVITTLVFELPFLIFSLGAWIGVFDYKHL